MSQQGENVQLTCPSCGQPYLIQAIYQNTPHQCPMCGAMAGAQPMQQQGMPLQPQAPAPGMQPGMQQPGVPQPGMQQPGYPAYQNPMPPGHGKSAAGKSNKNTVVFIVRCVLAVVAVVAIIWTLIYIMNRNYNVTVNLGNASEIGGSGSLNAGTFDVKPGKTFKAKFKIKALSGQDLFYEIRRADIPGASITEAGQFEWKIPDDLEPGRVEFNFSLKDRNSRGQITDVVKIAFNVL